MFFFFKQKTAYEVRISDWSSDVCSSDLDILHEGGDVDVLDRIAAGSGGRGGGRVGSETVHRAIFSCLACRVWSMRARLLRRAAANTAMKAKGLPPNQQQHGAHVRCRCCRK